MAQPDLLVQSVRRLVRRIYQVVFVALNKILGLKKELLIVLPRIPVPKEFLESKETSVSQKVRISPSKYTGYQASFVTPSGKNRYTPEGSTLCIILKLNAIRNVNL